MAIRTEIAHPQLHLILHLNLGGHRGWWQWNLVVALTVEGVASWNRNLINVLETPMSFQRIFNPATTSFSLGVLGASGSGIAKAKILCWPFGHFANSGFVAYGLAQCARIIIVI